MRHNSLMRRWKVGRFSAISRLCRKFRFELFVDGFGGDLMPFGIHMAFVGMKEFFPRFAVECFQMKGQIDKADVQFPAFLDNLFPKILLELS